jgi:hypothetical protein
MQRNAKLAISFIRFQYLPHLIFTLIFCLMSVFFVSFQNLNMSQAARIIEMYVSFIGILLLVPLFMPEQDRQIWNLEKSKKTPMWQLYMIRLVIALTVIAVTIAIFLFVIQQSESEIAYGQMWLCGASEIVFLGCIGYFVSAVTNQVVLGYMASVMYYAVNIGKSDIFGQLALFQMTKGQYDFAGYMLFAAVILVISGIRIRR